jgi:hypothetical protein
MKVLLRLFQKVHCAALVEEDLSINCIPASLFDGLGLAALHPTDEYRASVEAWTYVGDINLG